MFRQLRTIETLNKGIISDKSYSIEKKLNKYKFDVNKLKELNNMTKNVKERWTTDDELLLKEAVNDGLSAKEILELLPGRTNKAIYNKLLRLNIYDKNKHSCLIANENIKEKIKAPKLPEIKETNDESYIVRVDGKISYAGTNKNKCLGFIDAVKDFKKGVTVTLTKVIEIVEVL